MKGRKFMPLVAAAVVSVLTLAVAGRAELPVGFLSRGGGPLAVSAAIENGRPTGVWLCGQGRLVFTGELTP